jgi:hypothetical protein
MIALDWVSGSCWKRRPSGFLEFLEQIDETAGVDAGGFGRGEREIGPGEQGGIGLCAAPILFLQDAQVEPTDR